MPWEADFETEEGKGRKQEWAKLLPGAAVQSQGRPGPSQGALALGWPFREPQVGLGGWPAVRGLGHSAKAVHEKH